jgi:hypothetical protein
MSRQTARAARPEQTIFRCAIYTRKSTDDRLEQKFNLLDAQRLSGVDSQIQSLIPCRDGSASPSISDFDCSVLQSLQTV